MHNLLFLAPKHFAERRLRAAWLVCSLALAGLAVPVTASTILLGMGDSLTHGTMDATNNATNTLNAYLQKVADALQEAEDPSLTLIFSQPLFDDVTGERLQPFRIPTNLGVDGADSFSLEGYEYYKRAGVNESYLTDDYLCEQWLPSQLDDKYDRVLYPINLLTRQPVSQMDVAEWWLDRAAHRRQHSVMVFWVGNNDSSTAALGSGGLNPSLLPIPLEQIRPEITPALRLLLKVAQQQGELSFDSYTQQNIDRNLTDLGDFDKQYNHLLDRLTTAAAQSGSDFDLLLLTLPYYSSVGYLMDADDLEFYLRKVDPTYTVPASFKRPLKPPVGLAANGDRISLLTFGLMYALLNSGYSVDYVNGILEQNGIQQDGLVLSEVEQQTIIDRIDGFNQVIDLAGASRGLQVLDIGRRLNDILSGLTPVEIGGRVFDRHWGRGNAFSLDGVHPGYTGHALIANGVIEKLNQMLGVNAPLYDLDAVSTDDPYVDQDGDGWVPGPTAEATGIGELLLLFRDPNDGDENEQVSLPNDVWELISNALLKELLGIDRVRAEAERLGIVKPE